jgi:hypothetical protein
MKHLTLHRLASSLHRCQHYIDPYRNRQINREKLSKKYVKAKVKMFFGFATEMTNFLEIALGIHRFITSQR